MARKVDDQLSEALGATTPAGLRVVKVDDMAHLVEAVNLAVERQTHALEEAEDQALTHLPWPLRGTVRRILASDR
ncbi:MAG: hypothetical protein JHD02_00905 [Thermoleophilaceae bacterium]|nr:hypothetical protein [Thermoleophilaceae bacterium]